jgi:uncharacterized protein (DUF885 family)
MTAMDPPEPSALIDDVVRELLDRHPEYATGLGRHDDDHLLDDASPEALADESRWLRSRLGDVDLARAEAAAGADVAGQVDLEILANALERRRFQLEDLRDHEWDPLDSNPGTALYHLLARDFAPLEDRLRSLAGRLDAVPGALATARASLREMPRVHVETALTQFAGARTLIATEVAAALDQADGLRAVVDPAAERAVEAINTHLAWLESQLDSAGRDPRLGPELFGRKLALTLDTALDADAVLAAAEANLARTTELIEQTAAMLDDGPADGRVRRVLDRLAAEGRITDETILPTCEKALDGTRAFIREHDLVTVPDAPVRIVVMPEIHRGVAVAYCDAPGPLETRPLDTYFAVSPTPNDWTDERVRSFYREYNAYMLENLTIHEAMPGHVLQLAHSNGLTGGSLARRAFWSGSFVEGWAVLAEELMVGAGYGGEDNLKIRMQQLKMQLRLSINAILDVRVHAHGMTEDEGMRLMMERGHQEDGEAAGKWRRALLTSSQLSTYFVGYVENSAIAADLRAERPELSTRERHDAMLAHGSPPPRHLRTLLGLGPAAR